MARTHTTIDSPLGELMLVAVDGVLSGGAVGRNPLSVIVPCHRVVGKDGKLTGYAGGLERKRFLLELEAREAVAASGSRLFMRIRSPSDRTVVPSGLRWPGGHHHRSAAR